MVNLSLCLFKHSWETHESVYAFLICLLGGGELSAHTPASSLLVPTGYKATDDQARKHLIGLGNNGWSA